jgi:hypothetical protein
MKSSNSSKPIYTAVLLDVMSTPDDDVENRLNEPLLGSDNINNNKDPTISTASSSVMTMIGKIIQTCSFVGGMVLGALFSVGGFCFLIRHWAHMNPWQR